MSILGEDVGCGDPSEVERLGWAECSLAASSQGSRLQPPFVSSGCCQARGPRTWAFFP